MTPEDTAPDEEFALAITQKTQVRNIFTYIRTFIMHNCMVHLLLSTYIMSPFRKNK